MYEYYMNQQYKEYHAQRMRENAPPNSNMNEVPEEERYKGVALGCFILVCLVLMFLLEEETDQRKDHPTLYYGPPRVHPEVLTCLPT